MRPSFDSPGSSLKGAISITWGRYQVGKQAARVARDMLPLYGAF